MNTISKASNAVIEAHGITKHYGNVTALSGINLSIKKGEIFGVLGANSSGKTTLLRILCGLITPCSGTGHCLNIPFAAPQKLIRSRQRLIGYLSQDFTLYNDLSIKENLLFRARIFSMDEPEKTVELALSKYALTEKQDQLAGQLSAGWRRRLELAACLLHRPSLIMLDEPTAGLDIAARNDFWREIESLANLGITVILNTHDNSEAERCNRIAYLSHGRIVVTGTPKNLIGDANCTVWWLTGGNVATDFTSQLRVLPGVVHVEGGDKHLKLILHRHPATASAINAISKQHGLVISSTVPRLDEALLQLVHKNNGKRIISRHA